MGLLALWAANPALTFDGHSVKEGPLALVIEEVSPVTQFDTPSTVSVVLENTAARPLEVELRLDDLVDEWRAVGESTRHIRIGAGDTISLNDALLRAGGIIPSPSGSKVRIVKGGLLSAVVLAIEGEVFSLVDEDGKPHVPEVALRNNDFVYVFASRAKAIATGTVGVKEITVLGEVKRQGVFRFAAGEPCTIMHLMFKMGALPPYANRKAIKILRRTEGGIDKEIKVNIEEILDDGDPDDDVPLENGDRVVVPARRLHLF